MTFLLLNENSLAQVRVNNELEQMLQRHCHVEAKLQNISKVLPNVVVIRTESQKFSDMINRTNRLAEAVSAKVRQLDLARVCKKFLDQ